MNMSVNHVCICLYLRAWFFHDMYQYLFMNPVSYILVSTLYIYCIHLFKQYMYMSVQGVSPFHNMKMHNLALLWAFP